MLNPETKIMVIQLKVNNKLCPRSGWLIKKVIIKSKIKKEYKYLLYKFVFSSITIIFATKIIKRGFTSSIGWNLGRKNKFNHLFEPFTSTPKKIIRKSINTEIKNKYGNNLIRLFLFWIEIITIKDRDMETKIKCFIKKK